MVLGLYAKLLDVVYISEHPGLKFLYSLVQLRENPEHQLKGCKSTSLRGRRPRMDLCFFSILKSDVPSPHIKP